MKGELDIQKELLPYLQEIVSLEQAAYVEESLLNAVKNERENTDTRKYVVPEPKPPMRATIDTESFALITVFVGGPIAIGVGVLRSINTFDFGAGFGAAFIVFAIFAFLVFLWVAVDALRLGICRSAYPLGYTSWRTSHPARRKRNVPVLPMTSFANLSFAPYAVTISTI